MARIRSIKPEFWSSEQVMDCSVVARLLFIGLWNFCDDKGRLPLKPRQIKASVFPGDDISTTDILGIVQELARNGLIKCYIIDEQKYLCITGWHHQRINKPQPAKYPGPDDDTSGNIPGLFPPDRIGEEGKGREDSVSNETGSTPKAVDPTKVVYDTGKALLKKYDIADSTSGGLITKWRKRLPDDELLLVLTRAGAAERHDIVAFIEGCIRGEEPEQFRDVTADAKAQELLRLRGWKKNRVWLAIWDEEEPIDDAEADRRIAALEDPLAIPPAFDRRGELATKGGER